MRDKNNHPKIGLSKLKHKALPLSIEEALKDEIPMDWSTPMIYGEEQVKRIPCLNRRYAVEVIEDEWSGGYVAIHPTLKGCITTGKSDTEAISNLKDAKIEWMIAALESGISIPKPDFYRLQSIYKNQKNRIRKPSRQRI